MSKQFRIYYTSAPDKSKADVLAADMVVPMDSGVLVLYNQVPGGGNQLVRMYAPGSWFIAEEIAPAAAPIATGPMTPAATTGPDTGINHERDV